MVLTMARTDLLGRLADLRLDELQKRVRGLEELEARLTALERKVDKLGKSSAPATASRKTASTKSSGTTRAKKS